jgi:ATP-dependent DNA helicase PIF1
MAGLVNGARGTVDCIGYAPHADPTKDIPLVVFVCFPTYTGPVDPRWQSQANADCPVVSITPFTTHWDTRDGHSLSRTQFPLTLAWGISIHKSQGLTLERAVIDLGPSDFAVGLSYVAISWVKSIKGIAFRTSFDLTCLQKVNNPEGGIQGMLLQDNVRCEQLDFHENPYDVDVSEYLFLD